MLPTTIAMSDDVSGSQNQSQINPIFVGSQGPEISSGEGNKPTWKVSIQKEPLVANRKATCRLVTGIAH